MEKNMSTSTFDTLSMDPVKYKTDTNDGFHKKYGYTHRINALIRWASGDLREIGFWFKGVPTIENIQTFANNAKLAAVEVVCHVVTEI
jgi:hypothetical protein